MPTVWRVLSEESRVSILHQGLPNFKTCTAKTLKANGAHTPEKWLLKGLPAQIHRPSMEATSGGVPRLFRRGSFACLRTLTWGAGISFGAYFQLGWSTVVLHTSCCPSFYIWWPSFCCCQGMPIHLLAMLPVGHTWRSYRIIYNGEKVLRQLPPMGPASNYRPRSSVFLWQRPIRATAWEAGF